MLSVILRTYNGEHVLLDVLRPLVSAAAEGMVRDVCFLDLGSTDGTATIADAAGATLVTSPSDTGKQTRTALEAAHRADWVLLLDQITVLAPDWLTETTSFIERQGRTRSHQRPMSAVFRPEYEPVSGSADLRRRVGVFLANRLLSTAILSQGVLLRRENLLGEVGARFDWHAADPSIRLPTITRLRSCSHLAQPMDWPAETPQAPASASDLSRATP
jgi:glycosyltransferase involved in cell wall biosynthesis